MCDESQHFLEKCPKDKTADAGAGPRLIFIDNTIEARIKRNKEEFRAQSVVSGCVRAKRVYDPVKAKAYRDANKERLNEQARLRHSKNNKKHVERLRKEYNTSLINGEDTRQHKYYIEHIEERKAYRKKYYEEVEAPKRKALLKNI